MAILTTLSNLHDRISFIEAVCAELSPIFTSFLSSQYAAGYKCETGIKLHDGCYGYLQISNYSSGNSKDWIEFSVEISPRGQATMTHDYYSSGVHDKTSQTCITIDFAPTDTIEDLSARILGSTMSDFGDEPCIGFSRFMNLYITQHLKPTRTIGINPIL